MFKGCCFGNGRGGAHAAVDSPELPKRRLEAEGEGKATGVAKEADKVKDPEGNTEDTQETATIQGVGRPSSDMLLAKDKDGSNGISAVGRGRESGGDARLFGWQNVEIHICVKFKFKVPSEGGEQSGGGGCIKSIGWR